MKTFWLKDGIPPKIARSSGRNDHPFGAALKKDRFSAWASTVCKSAERIRVFCRKSDEHVVQPYSCTLKQSSRRISCIHKPSWPSVFIKCLIYGPGSPLYATKHNAVSSVMHGPPSWQRWHKRGKQIKNQIQRTDQLSCATAFFYGDFLGCTL